MRPHLFFSLIVILASSLFFAPAASAQDDDEQFQPQPRQQLRGGNNRNPARPNVLRQLGLSQDQMRKIREYNVARRPRIEEAHRRFRDAGRLLDQAIYADQLNEAEVRLRMKAVQEAQAELISIRSASELAIRQILTPEQLVKFRQLRQRFEENNRQDRRMPGGGPVGDPAGLRPADRRGPRPARLPGT